MNRDLPDGVINAEPDGGWESEDVADEVASASHDEDAADPTVPVEGIDPDLQADEQVD